MKRLLPFAALLSIPFTQVLGAAPKKNPLTEIDLKSYVESIPDDYTLEKMDTTGKGVIDLFTIFKKGDADKRILVRQVYDLNQDGKIDMANHYQAGKRVKSEFDLDYDGKVDTVTEFDMQTGAVAKKTLVENDKLTWKYWFKGELRRKELDRNGDGEPDMWVSYRNGRVVRTEIDVNFDGKNIRLEGDLNKSKTGE